MQPDNTKFYAEKMTMLDFKMLKGQVDTPENFDANKVIGHTVDNSLQLGFNIKDKLAKADFNITITSDSKGENAIESTGNFHLLFIYHIENLEELMVKKKNGLQMNPELANAVSAVSYSTARGILITRLQGTAFQRFILPIINPTDLLRHKE